jgi:hypothetical protein
MFRLTKENQIYQQDYCGCVHGLINQKGEEALWDLVSFRGRAPGSKEETLFIKRVRTFCEGIGLRVEEYEFPFLGWKVLEGGLRIGKEAVPSLIKPYSRSIRGKVRADVERKVGNILYLNKQHVRIELVSGLSSYPLENPPPTINPTFLVPKSYEERLITNRIEATLRTAFTEEVSRLLLVGDVRARDIVGIPADTLQDGRGVTEEEVKDLIRSSERDIKKGIKAVLLMGAHSLGRLGERYFEEITGKRPTEVLDY